MLTKRKKKKTVNFSLPGTDFRHIQAIFALFMFKRQRNENFKTLHVSRWFLLSFSSETARFEMFGGFDRTTPRSAPYSLAPYSVYSEWSQRFHTTTVFLLPANLLMILLCMQSPRVTHIYPSLTTATILCKQIIKKIDEMCAKKMSQDSACTSYFCLLFFFQFFVLPVGAFCSSVP